MKKFLNVISLTLAVALMSGCQIHKQDTKAGEVRTVEAECVDNTDGNLEDKEQSGEGQVSEKQETNEKSDSKVVILSEVNGQTAIEVSEEKAQENVVVSSQTKTADKAQASKQVEVKESVANKSNIDQSSDAVQAVETKSATVEKPIAKSTTKSTQVQKPAATTKPTQTSKPVATTKPAQTDKAEQQKSVVTLAVYGDDATILAAVEVKLEDKETVFDVLKKTLKDKKIQMEYTGKGESVYVEGINNLYEFDKGSTSGWMYNVNGTYPNKSAGAYILKAGDTVEWRYTLDLGKDLGANSVKQ